VLQTLRKNFGLKLFSLALAVGGWAFFRFLAGPSFTAPFGERIGFNSDAQAVTQRTFHVSIDYAGVNGSIVAEQTGITPETVEITGPADALSSIRAVRVQIPFATEAGTYDTMVSPTIDAPGIERSAFDISPDYVRVRVSFVRASS